MNEKPYIPNYLAQAILVTIFCCLPLGIPAIVFSSQVNSKLVYGDVQGAQDSSKKAKMWCWISFGVGIALAFIWIIFYLFIGTALFFEGYHNMG
jgi:hypothetical protein